MMREPDSSTEMKIKAVAPWFGGKRTLAPIIVQELGLHNMFLEPFCGSAAVLFAKKPCANETINDLHGDLINLAMVLASKAWRGLYEQVDRTLNCEAVIDAYREQFAKDFQPPANPADVTEQCVDRAAAYMALSWICRNGASGTKRINYQMALRYTASGGSPGSRWRSAVDSVPAWHDRLKGVQIINRDGLGLLEKVADEETTAIYVDPPYFESTIGGSKYLYRFDEQAEPLWGKQDDHARLAELLGRFKHARVVVSYYDDPRLDELYVKHGWTKRDVKRHKNLHTQNKRGSTVSIAPEVLLINGPSRNGI